MLATVCFNPIPASAQETDLTTQLDAFDPATADPVMPTTSLDELRHPSERDIYDVDTTGWDFNEPGVNKNNIDNHYYEHTLPTDLGKPQPEIIDGHMRSDRIQLPGGVTKEQADRAEVQEAKQLGITTPGDEPLMQPLAAENCRTYWPSPHQVCGTIREKYESLAVAWAGQTPLSFLGLPKSGELTNPDGVGKRTEFDNGFIYWHPDTGAWSVTTHNSIVWARNGWEQGRLGYPTSDEIGTGDGVGRKQSFQRGRIYTSLSGVVSIEGKILEKWIETGEERGPLGYPATDEEGTPDGIGRYNRFALGMIYWHPSYGAHPIEGAIGAVWQRAGYEMSQYGYPTSDPLFDQETGYSQKFSNKPLILKDLFNWNGSILINGKHISRGLYDFNFQILGIDLKTLPSTSHQTQDSYTKSHPAPMTKPRDGAAFINLADVIPQQDSYYTKNGKEYYVSSPIKWPLDYEYNPQAPRRKVHDFCTWSTDLWGGMPPQSLIMADFRGPCAIHDQCFVKYTDRENRLSICNPQFKDKMIANCRGVYASPTVTQSCIAESYARHALVQTGEYLTNW